MRPAPENGYLFVDFNAYFASVEQQDDPRLRGRPVVVAPVASEHTSAIAASYEAKARGVKTGTRIAEARRICPGLVVRVARPRLYVDYHRRLMAEIERHAPLHKVHSIDECSCRLGLAEREPQTARALAHAIKAGIARAVGPALTCSIGIAATPLLAKIASDLEKPDGLVILPTERVPERLAAWRLRDIAGIGERMERRLLAAGVATIADLWALAPKQARAIWGGVGGERFWCQLHGYDAPEPESGERHSLGHGRVLDWEWRLPERARLVARELLLAAARRLRRHGLATGSLAVSVRSRTGEGRAAEASFPATQDSFALMARLDAAWADLRLPPGAPLKRVAVWLTRLTPEHERARDLFALDDSGPARREHLWRLLDALPARVGGRVVPASQAGVHLADLGTKIAFTRIPSENDFLA